MKVVNIPKKIHWYGNRVCHVTAIFLNATFKPRILQKDLLFHPFK